MSDKEPVEQSPDHVGLVGGISTDEQVGKPTAHPLGQIGSVGGVPTNEQVGELTVWLTYSFAPDWFEDALHEAKTGIDHNAQRREIVFAVCCAESYLFEWVRDEIIGKSAMEELIKYLNKYFPPGKRMGVLDRWKFVTKQLWKDGFIGEPDFSRAYWGDFMQLVEVRNGLVHARASRPETAQQPQEEKPVPSKNDLDELPAGWATKVVVELIKTLHRSVGTSCPSWLVAP
jgi:hypothetical protein